MGIRVFHLAHFLLQISTLLFATLYIFCHIVLTRFKKPAEFTTGTRTSLLLPALLPVPVAMAPASGEEGCVAAGKAEVLSSASLPPQAGTRYGGESRRRASHVTFMTSVSFSTK